MNFRPHKDEYYLGIARSICKRSPCLRRKYGAIIVKNDVIVSSGYNGPARGVINCFEIGCLKDLVNAPSGTAYEFCPAVHAEENAIINAARSGTSILGGKMYIYGEDVKTGEVVEALPCDRCKRAIINAGIKQVIIKRRDNILKINVLEWVKEDTWNYMKKIEDIKRKS